VYYVFFKNVVYVLSLFFIKIYVFIIVSLANILTKLIFCLQSKYCKNNNMDFNRNYRCLQSLENIDNGDNFYRVLSSCQRLEEIHFFYIDLNDRYLELLSQCQNLEQLYFHDVGLRSIDIMKRCSVIFERCSNLQKFYFIYTYKQQDLANLIDIWKKKYPHVSICLLYIYVGTPELDYRQRA